MAKCITTVCIIIFLPLFLYSHEYDPSPGSAPTIKFEHLLVKDGLSNNIVTSIIQDQQGFMWFATENGLNKYDGYTFRTFKNDPNDSTSLSNNYIYSLFLDNHGSLWIATAFGLNKYNKNTDKFRRYFNSPQEERGANNNMIQSFFKPGPKDDDLLWVGTNNGVYQFFMDSGNFREYLTKEKIGLRPGAYGIWDFAEDHHGIIWISSSSGLFRFDSRKFQVTPYNNILGISENETTTGILFLCLDKTGDIWLGTLDENLGLIRLNTKTDKTVHYTHHPDDPTSLSNNSILKPFIDSSGDLWWKFLTLA